MKKAQTGIGTLITFIAMLIVASITANVLIQTSQSLQNQALKTGKQTQQAISTSARALGLVGINGSDGTVEDFMLELKLIAGSESIDLTKAMLSFNYEESGYTYTYSNGTCVNDSSIGYSTDGTNNNGTFTIKYLVTGNSYTKGYLQRGEIIDVCFALPGGTSLSEDREADIRFTPQVGIPTSISFMTNSVITGYRVKLYP
jgi:archaellin